MPQKSKTKNAPNDKRHENNSGLAPPVARRVTRQRSQGQLNGQLNGKLPTSVSPPPLPSTGLNAGYKWPRTADAAAENSSAAAARDHAAGGERGTRDRTPSDASVEEIGPCGEMADGIHEHHPAPHGADAASYKSTHSTGTLSAVSTILTYYPLRDAISILILLLSLPPTLVLVIQTLFASLTFVPPTAGLSLSTLPNVKEMFNSSNFGYPALATILFVDLVFWVCWLPVWRPLQAIFLDLSQAVIAVSLSGAAASTGGPTYSIATCTLIVCVVHVLRYKAIHLTALDYLRSVLHSWSGGLPFDVPDFATSFHSSTPLERRLAFTAMRTILGIHIVSQGVTTCIRRTLANAKANEKDSAVLTVTKTDTEATAGTDSPARSSLGPGDGPPPLHHSSSTDSRASGQAPSHRDAKQRESSKKKRKQANQVRSQQPLWAAIASTKVTFVKEMEQRDAADDAREAAVMDSDTTNLYATLANTTTDRIWIHEVRDNEIFFSVDLSPETSAEIDDPKNDSMTIAAGIDKSKPFYIRVNGAAWSSARIISAGDQSKAAVDRYLGEIFGLAPLSSYHCEIVSIAKKHVLCSASVITQPAPTAEQAFTAPIPPPHSALRPSSPITTLKQSIQSAEVKLNEARNRTKKTRKDQRAAHADIKREITVLRSKLESSGGVDDKQERRLQQISQHKNQAEDATVELKAQIEALGEIPHEELAASEVTRRAWQSALDEKKAADMDFEDAKLEQYRELNALRSDITAFESKREKLTARKAQRAQDLEKLAAKQQAEMSAKQKRDHERVLELREREVKQNELRFHTAQMDADANAIIQKAQDAWQQSSALSNWSNPASGFPGFSSPPTPDGVLSSTNGQINSQASNLPPDAFTSQTFGSPFTSHASISNVNPTAGPRGRSSSMLSQYSGFTDNADDYGFVPHEPRVLHTWPVQASGGAASDERKGSDGDSTSASVSGSGSASGETSVVNGSTNGSNSPRPEARPFIPGAAGTPYGTIGPPRKKTPHSPTKSNSGAIGSGR